MTAPTRYRGIPIRRFDVPCTPYVWAHDETDGHGTAETIEEAKDQIDAHLDRVATTPSEATTVAAKERNQT